MFLLSRLVMYHTANVHKRFCVEGMNAGNSLRKTACLRYFRNCDKVGCHIKYYKLPIFLQEQDSLHFTLLKSAAIDL